jgi:hypothetical protein
MAGRLAQPEGSQVGLLFCAVIVLVNAPPGPASNPAGLPSLNATVLQFCREHNGKQVGNGVCSEIAVAALAAADAKSRGFEPATDENGSPVWGTRIEQVNDVLPGDVIQFHKVRLLEVRPNGTKYLRWYPEHTAIVARVRGGGAFDVFEQNVITAGAGKERRGKLRIRDVNFRGMLEGTVTVYRPTASESAAQSVEQ